MSSTRNMQSAFLLALALAWATPAFGQHAMVAGGGLIAGVLPTPFSGNCIGRSTKLIGGEGRLGYVARNFEAALQLILAGEFDPNECLADPELVENGIRTYRRYSHDTPPGVRAAFAKAGYTLSPIPVTLLIGAGLDLDEIEPIISYGAALRAGQRQPRALVAIEIMQASVPFRTEQFEWKDFVLIRHDTIATGRSWRAMPTVRLGIEFVIGGRRDTQRAVPIGVPIQPTHSGAHYSANRDPDLAF